MSAGVAREKPLHIVAIHRGPAVEAEVQADRPGGAEVAEVHRADARRKARADGLAPAANRRFRPPSPASQGRGRATTSGRPRDPRAFPKDACQKGTSRFPQRSSPSRSCARSARRRASPDALGRSPPAIPCTLQRPVEHLGVVRGHVVAVPTIVGDQSRVRRNGPRARQPQVHVVVFAAPQAGIETAGGGKARRSYMTVACMPTMLHFKKST